VWYSLPVGLDAIVSTKIRIDQQIAVAIILFLIVLCVFVARRNRTLFKRLREAEISSNIMWDFHEIHNEKKVLSQGGSKEIIWEELFGEYSTLKIRVDANPFVDISVRTICTDLMLHDLKFNTRTTHKDAYEIMCESGVELLEREVRVSPGRFFVIVSLPENQAESAAYLEISERRLVKMPQHRKR